jgi:HEAT repeat protein
LGDFRDPQTVPHLVAYLLGLSESNLDGRLLGVISLGQIGHSDALPTLKDQLYSLRFGADTKELIKATVDAIEAIGGQNAIEILEGAKHQRGLRNMNDPLIDEAIKRIQLKI